MFNPEATLQFHKVRTVPYSQRALDDQGTGRTLESVDHSEGAAQIMSVLKPDRKYIVINIQKGLF